MTSQTLTQPRPHSNLLVALASALAGAVALLAVIGAVHLAGGESPQSSAPERSYTAPGDAFEIAVPQGWTALRGADLARTPGAVAVVRRSDGRGLVIVRRTGALKSDPRTLAEGLTSQLRAELPGFRLVGARVGQVRGGGAFLYTFVQGSEGTAQSIAVTSVGGATYRIDTVVPGDAPDAARQAGAIVGSFGT